jgi:transposase InsO family protein
MCGVLGVAVSSYYAWRQRPVSARQQANVALVVQIRAVYQRNRGTYGSPRICAELQAQGFACSENRVARLMRAHGIQVQQKKRFKSTTNSQHAFPVAPNLLNQDFQAQAPNEKWLVDVTYIPTAEGWLYLAVVLDLFSRKIVGWAMAAQHTRYLVIRALQMALQTRQPTQGLLHHSDRGSQYASHDYQDLLADAQCQVSMSRTGCVYDNAPLESFFATLKVELVHQRQYPSRAAARSDLFEYIECFYNRYRRHSALGYLSPADFEANYVLRLN